VNDQSPEPKAAESEVPDSVIPAGTLPPLRWRDLPEPLPWRRMVGPSVILVALSIGSGEFIIWPYITYKSGFVFFWACLLGVVTQFFVNMEIERWTLATGESAVTGFCRLSRDWAWIMLLLNILPWAWPGWATGAGDLMSWILWGPIEQVKNGEVTYASRYGTTFAVAGLVLVGVVLTAGPVVYKTVERIQTGLVVLILVLLVVVSAMVIRPDAVGAMVRGAASVGTMPPDSAGVPLMMLLGALAFAGAGGTMNLGQSNLIREKGYAMGRYIGRITSPVTGKEEPIPSTGYHFPDTPENRSRWAAWWRAANIEHFIVFFLGCLAALCCLSLIAYSLLYDANGALKPGMEKFGKGMNFVWGEAGALAQMGGSAGGFLKVCFLLAGVAVLLTTELGVLDVVSRISTDIVKVNWLRESRFWTPSRLYYAFLWGEILLGVGILLVYQYQDALRLLKLSSSMNGAVMFIYSLILLYMNAKCLPRKLSVTPLRFAALAWSAAFFGWFTFQAVKLDVIPLLR
jgi:hypothetical protein